ncbi:hypothetical protein [Halococcus saccharolyticus]|uniref:Uncharacterized protein n=1 Tax=Halococcus saccharolyticus DSM 5350 TaxID=1227455 RepID=M0MTA1_9EURY|nr:hypothetical protein [Halococcus saccharolyticus]EMA47964.1 hypothetical protein C449_00790 [Halococcus saccharolyticus DSM 5350]
MSKSADAPITEDLDWREVHERPSPSTMAIEPMRREAKEVTTAVFENNFNVDLDDALSSRSRKLQRELERRLGITYPDCPQCQTEGEWGQEPGEPLICYVCWEGPPEDIRHEVHRQWKRIFEVRDDE